MPRLFIIRHGETDFNLKRIVQGGGIDADLNETGIEQGKRFYNSWSKHPFKGIYVSGLKRTYQTLASFDTGKYTIQALPEFNEMGWGELEGKPFDPVNHQKFLDMNEAWSKGSLDEKFPGGESPKEVWQRVRRGLDKVLHANPDGDVLICSHGRTLRIMLSMVSGYGMEKMNWFPHDNTGLNILRAPGTGWFIERMNCLEHLYKI